MSEDLTDEPRHVCEHEVVAAGIRYRCRREGVVGVSTTGDDEAQWFCDDHAEEHVLTEGPDPHA